MIAAVKEAFEPKLLLTKEAAALALSVNGRTLQRLTARGEIRCVRIGCGKKPLLRYRLTDLEAFCAGLSQEKSLGDSNRKEFTRCSGQQ